MISDDVVWLAYAAAYFVERDRRHSILDRKRARSFRGRLLKEGEHDAFFTPEPTRETATLYEHCARALDLAIERSAPSGLPLILGGDWNDGMNRVGEHGKGESVWLGWFLLKTLGDFAPLAHRRAATTARAKKWDVHAKMLKKALERHAWDGEWYRRGSFDNGAPLGSHLSDECQIDSIAQSWSVLAGGDKEQSEKAMDSAFERLVDPELGIVKLFTPPFSKTENEPGYIKELSARRSRKWRPIHARCDLVRHRPGAHGQGQRCLALLSDAQPDHARGGRGCRSNATVSSPMSWRLTSIRATRAGEAAGRGIPGLPAGCIALRSKRSLASAARETKSSSIPRCRTNGRVFPPRLTIEAKPIASACPRNGSEKIPVIEVNGRKLKGLSFEIKAPDPIGAAPNVVPLRSKRK